MSWCAVSGETCPDVLYLVRSVLMCCIWWHLSSWQPPEWASQAFVSSLSGLSTIENLSRALCRPIGPPYKKNLLAPFLLYVMKGLDIFEGIPKTFSKKNNNAAFIGGEMKRNKRERRKMGERKKMDRKSDKVTSTYCTILYIQYG